MSGNSSFNELGNTGLRAMFGNKGKVVVVEWLDPTDGCVLDENSEARVS